MRILRFTFKNEGKWMMIFSLGLFLIGLVVTLILYLARTAR